jgi:hypothetical protein
MALRETAPYIGAGIAFLFGAPLLWFPPSSLAGQPGTAGAAFAFVTGGLGALGVTVTIPALHESAYKRGFADAKEKYFKP